jgi:hypothetical protein
MSMSKITRDLQWLTDDDGHLVGYRLNDGQEVTIGTTRPDNATAVVGAADVVSTVPADYLDDAVTVSNGNGVTTLTPIEIAAPGTYTKVRLYWRNISAASDRVLYVAANVPNATRGWKQSQDAKRRDASMVFGDHITLISAAPITSLVFSSDGSISNGTHNILVTWGN